MLRTLIDSPVGQARTHTRTHAHTLTHNVPQLSFTVAIVLLIITECPSLHSLRTGQRAVAVAAATLSLAACCMLGH